ncbi:MULTISPECIES: hypothetical protein [Sphingomonas]|uniref:Secreted protein n=1 Tax=Sphingomonas lycopersici TaxID=2951807 RepID=A0AA41ZE46_9SPHN|nr:MULTISPECIES: hypothetical protein [Sphingomonas]MCW6531806.1 hypothetical protein [Sphingomonas lycopersici]MCW6537436.1 hypothetical protein [Sphingomonas lycopersici]OJU16782.1 MAG: hypothetical protein BGN95_07480 [Sphingomonas sp. 66-10]
MLRPLITVALAVLPAAALAAQASQPAPAKAPAETVHQEAQAETGQPPKRIRSVTLSGTEKCPPSTSTEVVVCNRIDPNEQYRVPKELRRPPEVPAKNQSWVNRAQQQDEVGRTAGGLPNTCSAVGTGGQSGCAQMNARQWYLERQAIKRAQQEGTNPPPQD